MFNSTGKEFIEMTKYKHLEESDQSLGLPQPPLEEPYVGNGEGINLPAITSLNMPALDLTQAIMNRRSSRKYLDKSLTLDELTYLIWTTIGVKEIYEDRVTLRTVPSAGARHAFELYLLINNVEGLTPGLYRYMALSHQLFPVRLQEGVKDEVVEGCLNQAFVSTSAVTFIWVAEPYRMTYRYVERGYRYLLQDAGHSCQNLYLASQVVGCGCCAISAYDDDTMNEILDLDGEDEFVIYAATVGKI